MNNPAPTIESLRAAWADQRPLIQSIRKLDPFQQSHSRWGRLHAEYGIPLRRVGARIWTTHRDKIAMLDASYGDFMAVD